MDILILGAVVAPDGTSVARTLQQLSWLRYQSPLCFSDLEWRSGVRLHLAPLASFSLLPLPRGMHVHKVNNVLRVQR